MIVTLPWPPASLSGHAKGHWRSKSNPTAEYRRVAKEAVEAKPVPILAPKGDILVHVRFVPPDRRGDRVNFPNRMKPFYDGIAEALGVNDSRFLPSFEFSQPEKDNGRVVVSIEGASI